MKWRFPEMGVPLNYPLFHFNRMFHEINHPAMGVSPLMEPPKYPQMDLYHCLFVAVWWSQWYQWSQNVPNHPWQNNGPIMCPECQQEVACKHSPQRWRMMKTWSTLLHLIQGIWTWPYLATPKLLPLLIVVRRGSYLDWIRTIPTNQVVQPHLEPSFLF